MPQDQPSYALPIEAPTLDPDFARPMETPRLEEPAVKQIAPASPAPAPRREQVRETYEPRPVHHHRRHTESLLRRLWSTLFTHRHPEEEDQPPRESIPVPRRGEESSSRRPRSGQSQRRGGLDVGRHRNEPRPTQQTSGPQTVAESSTPQSREAGRPRQATEKATDRDRGGDRPRSGEQRGSRRGGRGRGRRGGEARRQESQSASGQQRTTEDAAPRESKNPKDEQRGAVNPQQPRRLDAGSGSARSAPTPPAAGPVTQSPGPQDAAPPLSDAKRHGTLPQGTQMQRNGSESVRGEAGRTPYGEELEPAPTASAGPNVNATSTATGQQRETARGEAYQTEDKTRSVEDTGTSTETKSNAPGGASGDEAEVTRRPRSGRRRRGGRGKKKVTAHRDGAQDKAAEGPQNPPEGGGSRTDSENRPAASQRRRQGARSVTEPPEGSTPSAETGRHPEHSPDKKPAVETPKQPLREPAGESQAMAQPEPPAIVSHSVDGAPSKEPRQPKGRSAMNHKGAEPSPAPDPQKTEASATPIERQPTAIPQPTQSKVNASSRSTQSEPGTARNAPEQQPPRKTPPSGTPDG